MVLPMRNNLQLSIAKNSDIVLYFYIAIIEQHCSTYIDINMDLHGVYFKMHIIKSDPYRSWLELPTRESEEMGYSPTVGKTCNLRFLRVPHSSINPIQMKSSVTYT